MSATLSRSARGEINQLPCIFAAALGQRCAVCSLVRHDAEQMLCTQPVARAACAALHGALHDKSRFALGQRGTRTAAGAELRLQCGGLAGLRDGLDPEAMAVDVQRLLERLQDMDAEALPWPQILRAIGAQGKRPAGQ